MVVMFLALLAASTPAASPSPSASPETLRTIVTVRSTTICSQFATHVNAAIDSAVGNDHALGGVITILRSSDLGNGPLARRNQIERLRSQADAMYRQYRDGETEVNRLRDLAVKATDADEKAQLKASADALGGALYKQHLIQRDLDGFLAYLDASDMRNNSEDVNKVTGNLNRPDMDPVTRWRPDAHPMDTGRNEMVLAGDETPQDDVRMAVSASHEFQDRMSPILQDENTAAQHIEQASTHC